MGRWTLVIAVAGCGGSTTGAAPDDCVAQFSEEDGYDFASDGSASVEDLQAECAAEGAADCEVVVTRAAAECIADGVGIGADGRSASLVYHVTHGAIVWNVQDVTTPASTPYDGSGGTGVTIHAGTGAILDEWTWTATP